LATAIDAVKRGGLVVYSTCSISPVENDDVMSKMLKKRGETVRVISPQTVLGELAGAGMPHFESEATKYGALVLPDRGGWGPLYFAVILKIGSS
jgi:16S rRNA C967 or C1407 C5-methylase (RsmB/RsmF family)